MTSAGSFGRFLGPHLAAVPLPAIVASRAIAGLDAQSADGVAVRADPGLAAALDQGYVTAFSWAAALLAVTAVLVVFLRVPKTAGPAVPTPAG
jgi:hypothetical protein